MASKKDDLSKYDDSSSWSNADGTEFKRDKGFYGHMTMKSMKKDGKKHMSSANDGDMC